MKIALAQLNPTIGDLKNNAQQILKTAQQVATQGVNLLLTPELSLCGYPPRDLLLNANFIAEMERELQQLAHDLPPDLYVSIGLATANPDAITTGSKPLFNSIAILAAGKVQHIFHKRLLPTYDVFDENRYFAPGSEANYFILDGIKIGVTVCEDLWNDEDFWGKRTYLVNPIAELAKLDIDLSINLSASPYSVGKQKIRSAMLKHAAVKYDRAVLYVNQIGANDDLIFDGCSLGFDRSGELVCQGKSFNRDLIIVEFDKSKQDLKTAKIQPQPDCTDAEIWQALVLGVRDYIHKCGFQKAILGLSGGIDSALVAAIAAEALGADNVLGVLMPSTYSSSHSVTDALALAANLGIKTETIPIGDLMQGFDRTLESQFKGTEFGLAEENIQSRIRGTLLMSMSNKFGYLLLSTGNKSEMAVGYCTLYGDMNGGLAVIADVPKMRVFSICKWLNREREIIPINIITKPPSAELKPGQVDQDSLPPYEILDAILDAIVCEHQSAQQIIDRGYDSQVVTKIIRLVKIAEFKRRQAPPGLKITDRAFGTGWRMPIASK
ncbi:NAD+ synthase [Chamaesiphon minutus]|uniref:Glutamine-dependent NAD(+) synthetase n=1 Tax=Chamaesiphon minutus (strain ATCC 27169 / PCC 6605) TaxID=1173020 RepID=K9UMJ0_CHAP6|nr:NAD+ synthase [Chamaesiphon minutus]AFY96045.1 NAD+ synthetase [Chamaesiphon minutus PCC 6605]